MENYNFSDFLRSNFLCSIKAVIPNFLSVLRIILTIPFIFYVLNGSYKVALFIFTVAAITDFFDGYCARLWKVESDFGRIIDPIADKFIMISSYFVLGKMHWIPTYLVVIVIARDIGILSVVSLCKIYSIPLEIKPLFSSKINTTVQLAYVIMILIYGSLQESIFTDYFNYFDSILSSILNVCAFVVGIFTIFSATEYIQKYYWIKNAVYTRR